MSGFVHLHVHSEYSLLDGACRVGRLVSRARELGQTALALTDSGVMFGCVDFYNECIAKEIKPIIGCETYFTPTSRTDRSSGVNEKPYELVLLCENNEGYHNLVKLVSQSFTEGYFADKPRCDRDLLKQYSKGLIALSGGENGMLWRLISQGRFAEAEAQAENFVSIFGKDNFFIELQDHGTDSERRTVPLLVKLAKKLGIKTVCTNDVRYAEKFEGYVRKIVSCIGRNVTVIGNEADDGKNDEHYLKADHEMLGHFSAEAAENTLHIADRCNVTLTFGETILPHFSVEGYESNDKYFRDCVLKGLYERYGSDPSDEVKNRVKYETKVIREMGFTDYFLIVADFIGYAKKQGIAVGPGRGSGAGSVCAYCLGITDIDPIRFGLLFERFLNPERVSMPDFDIDFCYLRRQEVIDYVIEKYGRDHVAQIITFGTMAAKAAIRDAGRVMGMSYARVDVPARLIPWGYTIDKALKSSEELRKLAASDNDIFRLLETARAIEGNVRNPSVHAAGIVITREPVTQYVPLYKTTDETVTQYTKDTLERLGLLKMDFLGLRYLTIIQDCCELIKKRIPDFDIKNIPEDDAEVYKMMSCGGTLGIFQFESAGMTSLLARLHPTSIEDLTAALALYRPGPMDSIPKYIANKHGKQKPVYKHPLLKEILGVTYGCIVYQEQVMKICRKLAGYTLGHADIVRRAMAKKKPEAMMLERESFVNGAKENGIDENTANEVFDDMVSFASYAFNKSHAAAYAVLSYRTAYLRCHYYKEFTASLLTNAQGDKAKYIEDLSQHGVKLLPPDVTCGEAGFTLEEGGIRFGMRFIRNVGDGVIELIKRKRSEQPFTDFYDFLHRTAGGGMNKRAVEALIKSGALDKLGSSRKMMLGCYEDIMNESSGTRDIEGQLDLFGEAGNAPQPMIRSFEGEMPLTELLSGEKEMLGVYISGHPLEGYRETAKKTGCTPVSKLDASLSGKNIRLLAHIQGKRSHTTKQNKLMCFLHLEDLTGEVEAIVFPEAFEKLSGKRYEQGDIRLVEGRLSSNEDEGIKLVVSDISDPDRIKLPRTVYVKLPDKQSDKLEKCREIADSLSKGADIIKICFEDSRSTETLCSGINADDAAADRFKCLCGNDCVAVK